MRTFSILLMLLVSIPTTAVCAKGEANANSQHPTVTSFVKGQEVFNKALAIYGGREKIQSIETVELNLEGKTVLRNQGFDHDNSIRTPRSERLIFDYTKNWAYFDVNKYFGPDLHNGDRIYVMKGDEDLFVYYDETNTAQDNDPANRLPSTTLIEWSLPQLILKRMLQSPRNINWQGQESIDGVSLDVLVFPWSPDQVLSLYFDTNSGYLKRLSRSSQDNVNGDSAIDYVFNGGTKTTGGFFVPETITVAVTEELVIEEYYKNVIFNGKLNETLFNRPEGVPFVHFDPPMAPKLMEIDAGVYVVDFSQTRANIFFVEMENYIIAIDAPTNWFYTTQAIQLIKGVSDKPIRFAIPTHFHDDHAGGIRAFVAEGATVVMPTADKAYYEQMVKAPYTMFPDAIQRNNMPGKFEIVNDRKIFEDGKRRLELINIGSPHSKNMFIGWLQNERIVITADTFEYFEGHPIPAASDAAIAFYESLKEHDIEPDKILEGHSRPFYTLADLQESVRLRSEKGQH